LLSNRYKDLNVYGHGGDDDECLGKIWFLKCKKCKTVFVAES